MALAPLSRTLESGDRLTPEEFDRIYADLPDVRAELVNGVVYVSGTPPRGRAQAKPFTQLLVLIAHYSLLHPETDCLGDASYNGTSVDRLQPDVCLYRTGPVQSAFVADDGYLRGAPEFVAEVAASSASYDLHDKLAVYQRAGVKEYLVWRVLDRAFSFFRLVDGAYQPVVPDERGVFASVEFPGLRIDGPSLVAGDLRAALSALG